MTSIDIKENERCEEPRFKTLNKPNNYVEGIYIKRR